MACKEKLWMKLGILFPAISLACGILVYAVPGVATGMLGLLTHSEWQFTIQPFDLFRFALGLILWAIIGAAVGVAYSKLCGCCEEKAGRKK